MTDTPALDELKRSIATVPWDRLAHAYHGAGDAPRALDLFITAGLPGKDHEAPDDWLWASILHQGSVYSASLPVMWILADLLAARPDHPNACDILWGLQTLAEDFINFCAEGDDHADETPLRRSEPGAPLWEAWVEAPVSVPQEVGDDYFIASRVRCTAIRQVVVHALPVIRSGLEHRNEAVRTAAVGAWCLAVQAVPEMPDAAASLRRLVGNPDYGPGEWISALMTLDALGEDVAPFLTDADRRLRLGAALAVGTAADARSTHELTAALLDLDWMEADVPGGIAHKDVQLRILVIEALLARNDPQEAGDGLVAGLSHVIRLQATKYPENLEWSPILQWAFGERKTRVPGVFTPLPKTLTPMQRAVLETLLSIETIWGRHSNASLPLAWVQLPHDRKAIRALLEDGAT